MLVFPFCCGNLESPFALVTGTVSFIGVPSFCLTPSVENLYEFTTECVRKELLIPPQLPLCHQYSLKMEFFRCLLDFLCYGLLCETEELLFLQPRSEERGAFSRVGLE